MGDKTSPYYGKAPRRLASAYAGTAVYDNWVFEDPKIKSPDIWYRGIPTSPMRVGPAAGKMCFDTTKVGKYCANVTQSTFPPKGEAATATAAAHSGGRFPFFPTGHALAEHVLAPGRSSTRGSSSEAAEILRHPAALGSRSPTRAGGVRRPVPASCTAFRFSFWRHLLPSV